MRYITFLFVFFHFFLQSIFSQNVLMDAINLSEFLNSVENEESFNFQRRNLDTFMSIYKKYHIYDSYNSFSDLIKANPFFCMGSDSCKINLGGVVTASDADIKNISPGISRSQPSFLNIPTLADGVSKFLVSRTKEELNFFFFYEIQKKIKNDSENLQLFFPRTTELIMYIGNDIYRYKQFIESLRLSFQNDIQELPKNLNNWILESDQNFQPEKIAFIRDVLGLANRISERPNTFDVMEYLGREGLISNISDPNNSNSDLSDRLKIAYFFAKSIENPDSLNSYYRPSEIYRHFQDKRVKYLYLGLMWEQSNKLIKASNVDNFRKYIESFGSDNPKYEGELIPFLERVSFRGIEASKSFRMIENRTDSIHFSSYQMLFEDIFYFIDEVYGSAKDLVFPGPRDSLFDDFSSRFRHIANLDLHSRFKNYSQAIYHALLVVASFREKGKGEKEQWEKDLMNIGLFGAQMASAKTSDEIAAVIENFALPPRSAMVKRNRKFMVSINAYTALMGGWEKLDLQPPFNDQLSGIVGVSAPIGLEFSFGSTVRNSISGSIFLSAIDIGAVTALRFSEDISSLPEFSFSNIVAPGAYLVFGLPKLPLSIGFGWQKGPQLRKIQQGLTEIDASGSKLSGFIGVDIPIFYINR